MKFKVVNFRPERISGWCFDPENLRVKGLIDLQVNQTVVASFPCHVFRQELSGEKFADRSIGFLGSLPPQYWTGDAHRAALVERHSGTVLAEKALKTPDAQVPGSAGVFADVQLGASGEVAGWMGQAGPKLRAALLVDGNRVHSVVADARTHRWDAKALKVTGPVGWAFSLQIPAVYFDGAEHQIQVVAQTQPEQTVIFDQRRILPDDEAGTAHHQEQTVKQDPPDNFPLAGWRAFPAWQNRWKLSGPVHTVGTQKSGALVLDNRKEEAVYLFQNAAREDLRCLRPYHGADLGVHRAFTVALEAGTSGEQPQVFIMQFDTHGTGLSRDLIPADQRGLFVADPQAEHLVLGIRLPGHGRYVVDSLEFLPAAEVRSAEPGIYPTELLPAVEEETPEQPETVELPGEGPELEGWTAAALGDWFEEQAAQLSAVHKALEELTRRSAATESAVEGLSRYAAQQRLRAAFGDRFTPEGGSHDSSA